MTKVRTVIPANAKPGQSMIQVIHPKTGKPTRVKVPKSAVPGQMVELELPDEVHQAITPQREGAKRPSNTAPGSEAPLASAPADPGNSSPVDFMPHPSQLPSPPNSTDKVAVSQEEQPLLEGSKPKSTKSSGCCTSCLTNPFAFTKSLFS